MQANHAAIQAGIIEEMMNDAIDMGDEEGLEEESEEIVDKVLFELTDGEFRTLHLGVCMLLPATRVLNGTLPHRLTRTSKQCETRRCRACRRN